MTILGSARQDRKIKTQALVIFRGKKDTVLYHGELLDTQNTSAHGDGNGLCTFLRHHSSLPPRIVTITRIFLLFLFWYFETIMYPPSSSNAFCLLSVFFHEHLSKRFVDSHLSSHFALIWDSREGPHCLSCAQGSVFVHSFAAFRPLRTYLRDNNHSVPITILPQKKRFNGG